MTREEIKNLVHAINKNFGEMFGFPRGFVKATTMDKGFWIKIWSRDVDFDEFGRDIGSGSELYPEFEIRKRSL